MKYKGKYKKLAEQFRKDGADDDTIEKWISEEMYCDELNNHSEVTDVNAYRVWASWPQKVRNIYLSNAFCINCGETSFTPGYNVLKYKHSIIIKGTCANCGSPIARVCD